MATAATIIHTDIMAGDMDTGDMDMDMADMEDTVMEDMADMGMDMDGQFAESLDAGVFDLDRNGIF